MIIKKIIRVFFSLVLSLTAAYGSLAAAVESSAGALSYSYGEIVDATRYEVEASMLREQQGWIIGMSVLVMLALALIICILLIAYIRNKKKSKTIAMQATTLTAIYNSIPAAVYTKDLNNEYTSCNYNLLKLAKASEETDLVGKKLFMPERLGADMSSLLHDMAEDNRKVLDEGITIIRENWITDLDNKRRAVQRVLSPLIQQGEVVGLLGIGMDITERKLAQEAAERSAERIEAIIGNLPGMVFQHIYNPPDFTCLFVSEGCKELTGYEPEDMLGDGAVKFFDFIHPDDTPIVVKLSAETLEKGLPYENTFRITTRDGEEKWVWERSRVVAKNPDGTPHIIEGYHADVTERMQLEGAMLEQKRMSSRIEAIISNLPGMVFQCLGTYPDYPLTFVSKGGKDLLGYTPEELVGGANKYMQMLHPDDLEEYENNVYETLDVGLPFENTHRLILKDGTVKWVLESCVVTEKNADGSPAVLDGYVFDITKQRQYEAAEHANRAKSEFLATMSHEIRTPMNSIIGFAELASSSDTLPQIKDYLSKITDSADWLLRIINDILDISKIESGKMELELVPFNLHEVFTRCQSVILPSVKEKGLDLRVYAEPIAGKQLIGDPVRLYQVLMNLLSNAVKFTSIGTVKFTALVKKVYENNAAIYFEVTDSGIGMSAEQMKRIFEPFIQADSSTTRNYGGSGLGLAIVKSIVELMGGVLMVKSSPDGGSTFCFEVMFDTVESDDELSRREDLMVMEKPNFNGLILICDDNTMNQEVICEHLSRVGIRSVVAQNGKIGVDMVRERTEKGEGPFDLILMDMFMPVMDGIEAATKIMELNTGTPIVAMTANIMVSELEKYKKHGMPDCLGKPFTSQELWRVLLKYLEPVSIDPIDGYEHGDEEMLRKLKINFVKNNKSAPAKIAEAVAAGDIKLAHRLAHSLKGNAGMIGKTGLKNAAAEIESLLKNEIDSIWEIKMKLLETELSLALEELGPVLDGSAQEKPSPAEPMDKAKMLELFDNLEHMLENLNPECAALLDDVRAIPGAEDLARQIEDFDFESASASLALLVKRLL